jgi:hypothetical protein
VSPGIVDPANDPAANIGRALSSTTPLSCSRLQLLWHRPTHATHPRRRAPTACQRITLARPGRLAAAAVGLGPWSYLGEVRLRRSGNRRVQDAPAYQNKGVPVAQVVRNGHLRERPTDSNPWWHVAATGGNRLAWRAPDPVLAVRAPFDLGFRCAISHSWILRPTAARLVSVSCVPSRRGQPAIWPTCSQQHSPME